MVGYLTLGSYLPQAAYSLVNAINTWSRPLSSSNFGPWHQLHICTTTTLELPLFDRLRQTYISTTTSLPIH